MYSSSHSGATGDNQTRLGVLSLDGLVHSLIGTMLRAYTSGKKRYMEFCDHLCLLPLPVSEVILLHFVAHLASLGLSYQTVELYLSAVRHMQIMCNLPDPSATSFSRLSYALRGLRRWLVRRDSSPVFQLCWKCLLRFTSFGHNHHLRLSLCCCRQLFVWDSLDLCTWANLLEGICLRLAYATGCSGEFSYNAI